MSPTTEGRSQVYPGGIDYPMYRLAFRVWMTFFLLLLCASLASYLANIIG